MTVSIDPNLIPMFTPGLLFAKLAHDPNFQVRWVTSTDPVYYASMNRPMADITVRQLVIARSLDQINLRLGHQSNFPFVTQAMFSTGATLPTSWIWDINVSTPSKWRNVRLAKIKRISGWNVEDNPTADGTCPTESTDPTTYIGRLRLIFTANENDGTAEVAVFKVDYDIGSGLTYQRVRVQAVETGEEVNVIDPAEAHTIKGQVTFRTLDVNTCDVRDFLDYLAPPTDRTDSDSDGEYDYPTEYDLASALVGSYSMNPVAHGAGMLVDSAYNSVPDLASSISNWVQAFNYPFRYSANRRSFTVTSQGPVYIPIGMFNEFNITAPAGDEPTGDDSGENYPVWISRIKRGTLTSDDPTNNTITMFFATYNVTDDAPSTAPVEFGYLTLSRNSAGGDVVKITPINNLMDVQGANSEFFNQQFGRGHVVLSAKWLGAREEIEEFFDMFGYIIGDDDISFLKDSTILSSYGISRIPKYTPTLGQSQALSGTAARRDDPVHPSDTNRYVTEADDGFGDRIDLIDDLEFEVNPDIERFGYSNSLVRKAVVLVVNSSGTHHEYERDILPRLRCLLGRDPQMFDLWFDGNRFKTYDAISGSWIG